MIILIAILGFILGGWSTELCRQYQNRKMFNTMMEDMGKELMERLEDAKRHSDSKDN